MREDAAMRIENEELLVEINPLGGALSRIYDKKEGKEILYDGKGAWMKTDLILFPVIGANNVYSLNGEQYRIPWKHGFAQHALFETEILSEASLVLSLQGNGEKESGYPFPFFLKLEYSLKGRELLRKTEIQGQDLTFQFGLHPAFRTDFSSCLLEVEEGTDLFVLDRTDGIIKKEIPWPYPLRWRIQKADIVDHDTFVLSNPKGEIRFRNGLGSSAFPMPLFRFMDPERRLERRFPLPRILVWHLSLCRYAYGLKQTERGQPRGWGPRFRRYSGLLTSRKRKENGLWAGEAKGRFNSPKVS